ncbi:MAG: DUF4148 domain-containing protein [Rhizobacter sp.]|nr:DUF4148 domain-containing protein [Rhizobacter sp.]
MNRKQTLTALALLVAGTAAFAQSEAELQYFGSSQPSTTTRAAVRAEVLKARADGQALVPAEVDVARVLPKAQASGKTREQVRAEVAKARADGSLTRLSELDAYDNTVASTRTRDEVRKEAIAATRAGQAARVQAGH